MSDLQRGILVEFARLTLMSVAFVVALYAFLSKDSRLREGIDKLLLVVFTVGCSSLLAVIAILCAVNEKTDSALILSNFAIAVFVVGWWILLATFWRVYGRRFHMRERRFLKYVAPFSWVHALVPNHYDEKISERESFYWAESMFPELSPRHLTGGGSILITGSGEIELSQIALGCLVDGLSHGETGDYVCCHMPPFQIWDLVKRHYPDAAKPDSPRPHFIDAFSPNLSFGDSILSKTLSGFEGGNAFTVIAAKGVAGVHTGCNSSWQKTKHQRQGQGTRRPHRMVYDRLSTLVPFSSSDQISNFILHCCVSERALGMITVLVEPDNAPSEILGSAKCAVDCVIEVRREDGKLQARVTKSRAAYLSDLGTWRPLFGDAPSALQPTTIGDAAVVPQAVNHS